MKERASWPMKAWEVRAILAGSKTQKRLVVKDRHIDAAPPACFFQWLRENCPYGQPGDRLWVRETVGDVGCRLTYKADTDDGAHCQVKRWTPSIHMPRWASRILLEIVSVRLERLQDISEEDARAEGAKPYLLPVHPDRENMRHVDGFSQLWQTVNGSDSWSANPWVWAIAFKRVAP